MEIAEDVCHSNAFMDVESRICRRDAYAFFVYLAHFASGKMSGWSGATCMGVLNGCFTPSARPKDDSAPGLGISADLGGRVGWFQERVKTLFLSFLKTHKKG